MLSAECWSIILLTALDLKTKLYVSWLKGLPWQSFSCMLTEVIVLKSKGESDSPGSECMTCCCYEPSLIWMLCVFCRSLWAAGWRAAPRSPPHQLDPAEASSLQNYRWDWTGILCGVRSHAHITMLMIGYHTWTWTLHPLLSNKDIWADEPVYFDGWSLTLSQLCITKIRVMKINYISLGVTLHYMWCYLIFSPSQSHLYNVWSKLLDPLVLADKTQSSHLV